MLLHDRKRNVAETQRLKCVLVNVCLLAATSPFPLSEPFPETSASIVSQSPRAAIELKDLHPFIHLKHPHPL